MKVAANAKRRKIQVASTGNFPTLLTVWLILILAAIALMARVVNLQIIDAKTLQERAKQQQEFTLTPFAPRRPIVDVRGTYLAIDKPIYNLAVHPYLYSDKFQPRDIAMQLAPIINEDVQKIQILLSQDASTVPIKKWLSESVAGQIRKISIKGEQVDGLELLQQNQRFYPQQNLAAEVIGYVNAEQKGQTGVELTQEQYLVQSGKAIDVQQDGRGRIKPTDLPEKMIHGDRRKLKLTIDENLQRLARQALKEAIAKYNAKRGAVLVMDVSNGEMPVLVTEPNFDPNLYYNYSKTPNLLRNWAVSDLYEPGSTFKPLNVAIALEAGAIQPDSVFNDEGSLTIGGWQVANFNYESVGAGGALTISQILERSSNVGMVHIIQQMKPAVYYQGLKSIGLGGPSGIDLYPEENSTIKSKKDFLTQVIEPATAAFGQGLALTPIQLLQMQGIIASGGIKLTPHVVRGLSDENNVTQLLKPVTPSPRIFSKSTTDAVIKMMTSVVEEGTGKPAKIAGYRLGGKTGTAQKSQNGGYSGGKITSFVGIFPSDAPKFVILAVVDEPKGTNAFGSTVAAPVVKTVVEGLIVSYGIPPTHPEELVKKE